MAAVSWLACRLPEGPLHRLAEFVGIAWYVIAPRRRGQARRNLRRVVRTLATDGRATERVRDAARSRVALELLVLAAFRQVTRYYLEVARAPASRAEGIARRIEDRSEGVFPALLRDRRGTGTRAGQGVIFVGLHFGALEFPSFLVTQAGIRVTAPMEVIANAPLQAYFMRTRNHEGLRLIPQERARPELVAALARGEAVGLVSDRVVRGRGTPATLFGHPLRLPAGAALLSMETGAPVYVAGVWRAGGDRYAGRMLPLEMPPAGARAARVRHFLQEQAAAFESLIAEAPEQWWSVFFPIWPDLETSAR